MTSARRGATLSLIALSVLVSFLVLSSLAAASPISEKKARLQAFQSQLTGVHEQTAIAVERYNEANSELAAVQGQIRRNRQLLQLAEGLPLVGQEFDHRFRHGGIVPRAEIPSERAGRRPFLGGISGGG